MPGETDKKFESEEIQEEQKFRYQPKGLTDRAKDVGISLFNAGTYLLRNISVGAQKSYQYAKEKTVAGVNFVEKKMGHEEDPFPQQEKKDTDITKDYSTKPSGDVIKQ